MSIEEERPGVPESGGLSATVANVPADRRARVRDWLGLTSLLCATYVALVDFFIVNVALPSIQRDTHASLGELQFIAVGYGASYAIFVITGGRLGDTFGRKRIFLLGTAAFAIASTLCGLAPTPAVLAAARVLQGLAASMLLPQAIGSIHTMFTGADRDRAFSVFGVAMGFAWVSGMMLGGLIVGANAFHLGWRLIFLINLPVLSAAIIGTLTWVQESRRPDSPHLDLLGVVSFAALVGLLLFPLIEGRQQGWPPWTIGCGALAIVIGVILVWLERATSARGLSPIMSPALFRNRRFILGLGVIVLFFLGPPGFFFLITLYLQQTLRFSAITFGLTLVPFGIAFLASSLTIKWFKARLAERVIILGISVMIAGIALVAWAIAVFGDSLTLADLVPGMVCLGSGQGLVTTPLYEMLLRDVPAEIASTATGVFTTVQQVIQSVSVAVIVIIFGFMRTAVTATTREAFSLTLSFNLLTLLLTAAIMAWHSVRIRRV